MTEQTTALVLVPGTLLAYNRTGDSIGVSGTFVPGTFVG